MDSTLPVIEDPSAPLVYTLNRSETSERLAVAVQWSGDAIFAIDYRVEPIDPDTLWLPKNPPENEPVTGTAVFDVGQSQITFWVRPLRDNLVESNEDVIVTVLEADEFGQVAGATDDAATGTSDKQYYLVDDQNRLGKLDPQTGLVDVIGTIDAPHGITDLAIIADGTLFGISADHLYEVDFNDVTLGEIATRSLGAHQIESATALVDGKDQPFVTGQGDLLALGSESLDLKRIHLEQVSDRWEWVSSETVAHLETALIPNDPSPNFKPAGGLYTWSSTLGVALSGFDDQGIALPYDSITQVYEFFPTTSATLPEPVQSSDGSSFDHIEGLLVIPIGIMALSGHSVVNVSPYQVTPSRYFELTGRPYDLGSSASVIGTISDGVQGSFHDRIGLHQGDLSLFHLRETLTAGIADIYAWFGPGDQPGWFPLAGDWDADGIDSIGLYHSETSLFHLTDSFTSTTADHLFAFGAPNSGWTPVAGDWDGDGVDSVGFYDPDRSQFQLKNSLTTGNATRFVQLGTVGADYIPISGDWDGDGTDGVGVYRSDTSTFLLYDSYETFDVAGSAIEFAFGPAGNVGWKPIAGDWDGDGVDSIGLFQPDNALFHLKDSFSGGRSDHYVHFGPAGATGWLPLAGDWNGKDLTTNTSVADASHPAFAITRSEDEEPSHSRLPYEAPRDLSPVHKLVADASDLPVELNSLAHLDDQLEIPEHRSSQRDPARQNELLVIRDEVFKTYIAEDLAH